MILKEGLKEGRSAGLAAVSTYLCAGCLLSLAAVALPPGSTLAHPRLPLLWLPLGVRRSTALAA